MSYEQAERKNIKRAEIDAKLVMTASDVACRTVAQEVIEFLRYVSCENGTQTGVPHLKTVLDGDGFDDDACARMLKRVRRTLARD